MRKIFFDPNGLRDELAGFIPKSKYLHDAGQTSIKIIESICEFSSGVRGHCLNANISSDIKTESPAFISFYNEWILGTDEDLIANAAIRIFESGWINKFDTDGLCGNRHEMAIKAISCITQEDKASAFGRIANYASNNGIDIATWVKLRVAYEKQR